MKISKFLLIPVFVLTGYSSVSIMFGCGFGYLGYFCYLGLPGLILSILGVTYLVVSFIASEIGKQSDSQDTRFDRRTAWLMATFIYCAIGLFYTITPLTDKYTAYYGNGLPDYLNMYAGILVVMFMPVFLGGQILFFVDYYTKKPVYWSLASVLITSAIFIYTLSISIFYVYYLFLFFGANMFLHRIIKGTLPNRTKENTEKYIKCFVLLATVLFIYSSVSFANNGTTYNQNVCAGNLGYSDILGSTGYERKIPDECSGLGWTSSTADLIKITNNPNTAVSAARRVIENSGSINGEWFDGDFVRHWPAEIISVDSVTETNEFPVCGRDGYLCYKVSMSIKIPDKDPTKIYKESITVYRGGVVGRD